MNTDITKEYLRYWNILDQNDKSIYKNKSYGGKINECPSKQYYDVYREYYIDKINGYPQYINNIKLDNLPDISTKPIEFIKRILEELFNNISVKQYLMEKKTKLHIHKHFGIERPKHGGLNHFRSFLFSTYAINIFIQNKLEDFKKYITSNKIELIFLIIASYFDVILRVDETCNPVQFFNDKNDNFKNIFIEISKNANVKTYFESGNKEFYMTTLGSSFLFMSICNYFKKKNTIIKNNLSDAFIEKIGLGLCMYEDKKAVLNTTDEKLKSIFLFYGLVSLGHYADHCRCTYSDILEQNHISFLLFDFIKLQKNNIQYINFVKYILLLLSFTDWDTQIEYKKKKDKKDWDNEIQLKKTNEICRTYSKCKIFNSDNFLTYSKNFNLMYNGIKTEFDTFINFETNINDMINFMDLPVLKKKKSVTFAKKNNVKKFEKLCQEYYENQEFVNPKINDIIKYNNDEWKVIEINVIKNIPLLIEKNLKCYIKIQNIKNNTIEQIVSPKECSYIRDSDEVKECKMVPLAGGNYKKKKKNISTKKIKLKLKSFKNKLRSKKQKK